MANDKNPDTTSIVGWHRDRDNSIHSRAVGETAPLIVIGALAYVPFVAKSPMDKFTVLPMQIFNWISRPQHGFAVNAAAAIIVLLVIVFMMNGVAIYLRNRFNRKLGK